jgi:hypothetical protein
MTSLASNETPRTLFMQLKVPTFPFYGRENVFSISQCFAKSTQEIELNRAEDCLPGHLLWPNRLNMNYCAYQHFLHYIWRITIVQSNLGLKQFLRRFILYLQPTYRGYHRGSSLLSGHIILVIWIMDCVSHCKPNTTLTSAFSIR